MKCYFYEPTLSMIIWVSQNTVGWCDKPTLSALIFDKPILSVIK